MSRITRERELRKFVGQTLQRDPATLNTSDDLVRDLGLDSMTSLRVLAAVETRFGVRFPDDHLSDLRSLEKILNVIEDQSGRSS